MKRDYSKWCSVALIAAIYALAGVAGWLLFEGLATNPLTANPLIRLFLADVLATIVVDMTIDTTTMCSHLQRKLFEGEYRAIREQIETDPTLTAVVRSRQLHIYRDGKKILILAGKSVPKIIRDDKLNELIY